MSKSINILPKDINPEESAVAEEPTTENGKIDPLELLQHDVKNNPNDLTKWEKLLKALDQIYQERYSSGNRDLIPEALKKTVKRSYENLLSRFPLLSNYWKAYSIFEFKLNGTKASIDVLEKAVSSFPHSMELWTDYLSALILTLGDKDDDYQLSSIRFQYNEALKLNGLNFSSHTLWDKIIEFETSIKENSRELLELYRKVTKIPLYQYAQYYNQFTQINKNYDAEKIIPKEEFKEYLEKFKKTSANDLSIVEKHQIVDDYTTKVFTSTQAQVTEKWPFESSLSIHEFSLEKVPEIENETENWVKYLDHEIDNYKQISESIPHDNGQTKNKSLKRQFEAVVNLFERALVPNYYNEDIWLKYVAFLNISLQDSEKKFDTTLHIYTRAVTNLPLDCIKIRLIYPKFLLKNGKLEMAGDYLVDLLKLFSGTQGPKIYLKEQYCLTIKSILQYWKRVENQRVYVDTLEKLINEHLPKLANSSKRTMAPSEPNEVSLIGSKVLTTVSKLLNEESISLIVVAYLKELQASQGNTEKIREFFNANYNHSAFKESIAFWAFFVEFEGLIHFNIVNLRFVVGYVKSRTMLPKSVVDSFLEIEYDVVSANLDSSYEDSRNDTGLTKILVNKDSEISSSIVHNSSARKRLANSNYKIRNLEAAKAKLANASKTPVLNREEELLRILRTHVAHPGIFVEAIPDVTNKFMNEGNGISLTKSKIVLPPFPTFKNVEKASAAITYPTQ
ncbi:pre-mRNA splicing factor [Scheffersomyces xylosifermentans]|uniref:pre-mRNA splicing factor n=1 Tax=Scheffersomyces xylosifermentans TaxID=1304137 RepID=UPI00315D7671